MTDPAFTSEEKLKVNVPCYAAVSECLCSMTVQLMLDGDV
jgi:hypothetical protein